MYFWDITPAVWTIKSGQWAGLCLCHTSGQNIYIVPLISRPGMLEKMINLVMLFPVLVPGTIYIARWGRTTGQARTQTRPDEVSRLESYLTGTVLWWRAGEQHHKYSLISLFSGARLPDCQTARANVSLPSSGMWDSGTSQITSYARPGQTRVKYKNSPAHHDKQQPLSPSLSLAIRNCIFYRQTVQFDSQSQFHINYCPTPFQV